MTGGVDIPYALPESEIKVEKDRRTGDSRCSTDNLMKIRKENRIRRF